MAIRIAAFLTALGASVCLTPAVRYFAHRWDLYDRPGGLKIHAGAIPRLAGVAIAVAFVAALAASGQPLNSEIAYFLGALGLVWLAGLIDDLRDLPPSIRLLAQVLASVLLYWGGWRVNVSNYPTINLIATIVLVMWFVNALNFVDGTDGLAAGITAVAAVAFAALFAAQGAHLFVAVTLALLGCCVGFLFFNFPPASIFMGDCGSTLLGMVLGFLTLAFLRSHPGLSFEIVVPLLFVALPLADAAFAVIRRLRQGKSPFSGDRRHFYDLLLHRGWSRPKVVLVSCWVSALFALVGLLGERAHLSGASGILAGVVVLTWGVQLGSLRPEPKIVRLFSTNSAGFVTDERKSNPLHEIAPATDAALRNP